jgi:hypothetical protein
VVAGPPQPGDTGILSIVNGNTLDLFDSSNTLLGSLTFFNKAGNKPLGLAGMQAAATQIACFAEGTMIETAHGPRRVESLAVGDEVVTRFGTDRVGWLATGGLRAPSPAGDGAAGAFGQNVPARDLFVSPDHAIYVDRVLVPAKLLTNGTTVRQVEMPRVTYHHIELERHDVVLAEGLPAETYLDAGDRTKFDCGAVFSLFPDFSARSAADTALAWETCGAAPLVTRNAEECHSRPAPETARAG